MLTSSGLSFKKWRADRKVKAEVAKWKKNGCPSPPPHSVKQDAIKDYAKKYGLRVFVETGTFRGDMVAAMQGEFEQIYSIELSQPLFEKAQIRFKDNKNIQLILGDSGKELAKIVAKLQAPTLFWLDGHYSAGETAKGDKDTPIYEELQHIFNAKDLGHVILIDDARCFGSESTYPTIDELIAFIRSCRSNVDIKVENDSVRITPKK